MNDDLQKARDGAVNTFVQTVIAIKHTHPALYKESLPTMRSYSEDFVDAMARYACLLYETAREENGK